MNQWEPSIVPFITRHHNHNTTTHRPAREIDIMSRTCYCVVMAIIGLVMKFIGSLVTRIHGHSTKLSPLKSNQKVLIIISLFLLLLIRCFFYSCFYYFTFYVQDISKILFLIFKMQVSKAIVTHSKQENKKKYSWKSFLVATEFASKIFGMKTIKSFKNRYRIEEKGGRDYLYSVQNLKRWEKFKRAKLQYFSLIIRWRNETENKQYRWENKSFREVFFLYITWGGRRFLPSLWFSLLDGNRRTCL